MKALRAWLSRHVVPAFYGTICVVTRYTVIPCYVRLRTVGFENVPRSGPLIVVANHLNDGDPGIMASRFPRRLVYMAKVELFRIPGLAQFMQLYGAIPVRRNEADLTALRRANDTLAQGLTLCIFPEGRSTGAKASLVEAWPGAGLIALRNDAPILPVAITGSQHLPMPGAFFRPFLRRADVTITVGEPFYLPKARANAEGAREATRQIMERIAALLPPEYRGYYGETQPAETVLTAPADESRE